MYLVSMYNEMSMEYATFLQTVSTEAQGVNEPVGLGLDCIAQNSAEAAGSRFRILRRRSTRSVREPLSVLSKSPGSSSSGTVATPQFVHHHNDSASSTSTADPGSEPSAPKRDGFNFLGHMTLPRALTNMELSRPRSPNLLGISASPKLWRKGSNTSLAQRTMDSPSKLNNANAAAPTSPRALHRPAAVPAKPNVVAPLSPRALHLHDASRVSHLEHDRLYYAGIHVMGSWVSNGEIVLRIRIQPAAAAMDGTVPPVYVIEKRSADLVNLYDRVMTRAQGLADGSAQKIRPLEPNMFQGPFNPWRLIQRNTAVDTLICALQRLPVWYDDIFGHFFRTNEVPSASTPMRQAYLLQKTNTEDAWAFKLCTLQQHVLKICDAHQPEHRNTIQLQQARIWYQMEDVRESDLGGTNIKCPLLVVQYMKQSSGASPSVCQITFTMESAEMLSEWHAALLSEVQSDKHSPSFNPRDMVSTPEPKLQLLPGFLQSRDAETGGKLQSIARSLPDRSGSTSPTLYQPGYEANRFIHGLSGLFRAGVVPENATLPHASPSAPDRRRFWHGFLGFGHMYNNANDDAFSAYSEQCIFGMPLHAVVQVFGHASGDTCSSPIPVVVFRCVEYLESGTRLFEEGIYRISGSSLAVKALCERFNMGDDVDLNGVADSSDLNKTLHRDPHIVSSVLKTYLRQLPENICTLPLLPELISTAELHDGTERAQSLRGVISRLPPENYALLRFLMHHFHHVSAAAEQNKMNIQNLAIVFSPTLNIPTNLLTILMADYPSIFESYVPHTTQESAHLL
ncbi:hypothetical protein MVES_001446 [Malassezia vespertilionis]|uniref:Rho-GAP domain-containing protein n=2 Tax=Malassezia vespertilionis TaxID=2020962 RepID=A0A2N1JCR9_9BASI|nr:hypothetical protein MVES_001446 [Malassezia vespertilionis]